MPAAYAAASAKADVPPRSGLAGTPFLLGTAAHNAHIQHIARSLDEAGALYAYVTGGVNPPSIGPLRAMQSRTITEVPGHLVQPHWGWEVPRIAASRVGALEIEDWLWERGEDALDRHCAKLLRRDDIGGFLGVEHGALASLKSARSAGKPGIVAFLSPHHATRERWVDAEFARFPELLSEGRKRVERLAPVRDRRRDEEAQTADWIETGSSFTTRSLVDSGLPADKILTIPLGCPDPIPANRLPAEPPQTARFIYVGPVSIRKGAHYLLDAWARVARPGVELHVYGKVLLPAAICERAQRTARGPIVFHGSVPAGDLPDVYLQSSVLILPTLCDGFGMVISEALAHGLPVVTTTNAGAADLIEHGRNGFVIPPADEDALARTLERCLDDPLALFAMRPAARAAAARWSWTDFRARHAQLVDQALSRG